jgi:hypothetical protein
MAPSKINVLISTFAGTGLPPTLSLALPATTPISSLSDELCARLPPNALCTRLLLSTLSSHPVPLSSPEPISHLLHPSKPESETDSGSQNDDEILPLRLHAALLGGKGGFGSQLRAAGGRMSKRKKGGAAALEEEQGSSRNLDGRRLRTVTEAKALAEYLAIKPEMERKEKERRRKRWEEIVEMAERRQDEIKYGSRKVGLDGKWVEDKEEVGERTREAVRLVMSQGAGAYRDNLMGVGATVGEGSGGGCSSNSGAESEEGEGEDGDKKIMDESEESGGSKATTPPSEPEAGSDIKRKGKEQENGKAPAKRFVGFDDDDEFMSSDDDSEGENAEA